MNSHRSTPAEGARRRGEESPAHSDIYSVLRAIGVVVVSVVLSGMVSTFLLAAAVIRPSRRVFAGTTRLWARMVLAACGVQLHVEGIEHLQGGRPSFFVGNHQAAIDIPILIAATGGDVRFIAKRSLLYIPVFGWALWRYGFVLLDRSDTRAAMRTLDRMLDRLPAQPISLIVFPEGTRSPDGRLLPFRRGAMKIGQRAGLPIVPFSIDGSCRVNPRGRFRIHPGAVRLTFGEPLAPEQVRGLSPAELHDHVRGEVARCLEQDGEPEEGTAVTRPQGS